MNLLDVIKKPLVTEKSTLQREGKSQYAFACAVDANKNQIKNAVEQAFKVDVVQVRTLVVRGKYGRSGAFIGKKSNWKKAIVSLKADQKIDLFGNV